MQVTQGLDGETQRGPSSHVSCAPCLLALGKTVLVSMLHVAPAAPACRCQGGEENYQKLQMCLPQAHRGVRPASANRATNTYNLAECVHSFLASLPWLLAGFCSTFSFQLSPARRSFYCSALSSEAPSHGSRRSGEHFGYG